MIAWHAALSCRNRTPTHSWLRVWLHSLVTSCCLFAAPVWTEEIPPEKPNLQVLPAPPSPSKLEQEVADFRVFVRRVALQGADQTITDSLRVITSQFESRFLESSDMRALPIALEREFQNRGFLLATAKVPDQAVVDGTLTVQILLGRIAEITFAPDPKWTRAAYLSRVVWPDLGKTVTLEQLQDRLVMLRDTNLVDKVNAELLPNIASHQGELRLAIDEPLPFWFSATYNNYHAPTIGARRWEIQGGHRSLTGWGDAVVGRFSDTPGLKAYSISYLLPIPHSDFYASFKHAKGDSLAIDPPVFRSLNITSVSDSNAVGMGYYFARTSSSTWLLSSIFERKDSQTFLLGLPFSFLPGIENGRNKLDVIHVVIEGTRKTASRIQTGKISVSQGKAHVVATELSGAVPSQRFTVVSGQFQIAQNIDTARRLQFVGRLDLQWTNKHLLPIERFGMGGVNSVRGFRENVVLRDRGAVASGELQVRLWETDSNIQISGSFFGDAGWSQNSDGRADGLPRTISSIGIGIKCQYKNNFLGQIQIARPSRWLTERLDSQDRGIHFAIVAAWP